MKIKKSLGTQWAPSPAWIIPKWTIHFVFIEYLHINFFGIIAVLQIMYSFGNNCDAIKIHFRHRPEHKSGGRESSSYIGSIKNINEAEYEASDELCKQQSWMVNNDQVFSILQCTSEWESHAQAHLFFFILDSIVDKPAFMTLSNDHGANIYANVSGQQSQPLYGNITDTTPLIRQPEYDPMIPETCPVFIDDLGQYVSENHSNLNAGFKEQYKVTVSISDSIYGRILIKHDIIIACNEGWSMTIILHVHNYAHLT